MSLTPEQAAKIDATLTNCSEIANLAEHLVSVFQSGGVQNPDLAVLQSQLETYVDTKVAEATIDETSAITALNTACGF